MSTFEMSVSFPVDSPNEGAVVRSLRRKNSKAILFVIALLTGFAAGAGAGGAAEGANPASCSLPVLAIPPTPSKPPGYAELDRTTGLHVTGTMPYRISVSDYRLEVSGEVDKPLNLAYDDLRCMPRTKGAPKLVCPGFFEDTATWAGAPLAYVLQSAQVRSSAKAVRLTGADGYSVEVPLTQALSESSFLAYEWEGKAVPALHGFPVRAIFPGQPGNQWVKWLVKIEVY